MIPPEIEKTVLRHIAELKKLNDDKVITDADHNTVGIIMQEHAGHFVGLSVFAWDTLKRLVEESRAVHYARQDAEKGGRR